MALVSTTSAEEYGTISGSTLTISSTEPNSNPFSETILTAVQVLDSTETSANGHQTKVRIEYADNQNGANDMEVRRVTYNTSGNTLTLGTIIDSSDGGSAITWSGSTVRVYGVATHEEIFPTQVITLQDPNTVEFSGAVSNATSTTFTAATSVSKVTPVSDQSVLQVTVTVSGFIERTASGGTLAGGVQCNYVNSSGTNTSIGLTKNIGFRNVAADDNMIDTFDTIFQFTLTQSHLNDETPAKWEIQPMMKVDGADRRVTCSNASMQVREILRLS